jgi:hypothetical protein
MDLKELCKRWLQREFGLANVEVVRIKVLERSEIDEMLGLVGVEFDFIEPSGRRGNSTAFFSTEEISVGELITRKIGVEAGA